MKKILVAIWCLNGKYQKKLLALEKNIHALRLHIGVHYLSACASMSE